MRRRCTVVLGSLAAAGLACRLDTLGLGDPPTTTASTTMGTTGASGVDPSTSTITPTTSTGSTTTTGVPCGPDPECQLGEVLTGALCEPCGREQRTCQDDCTWGPESCVQDLSSCVFWRFDLGLASWYRVALPEPPPIHAPAAPVGAAFERIADDDIVVLTDDTYHVYHSTGEWTASGALDAMFPDIAGPVLQSYSVYDDMGGYAVILFTGATADVYSLPVGSVQAEYVQTSPCCEPWNTQFDPGDIHLVRDIFTDLNGVTPWVDGEFVADCLDMQIYPIDLYSGWVTSNQVYVQELGICFELVQATPYAQFGPFAAAGSPPADLVGGVALLDQRFFVFAGE